MDQHQSEADMVMLVMDGKQLHFFCRQKGGYCRWVACESRDLYGFVRIHMLFTFVGQKFLKLHIECDSDGWNPQMNTISMVSAKGSLIKSFLVTH